MSGPPGFDPDFCDLCGSRDHEALVEIFHGRSMRSDRAVMAENLLKRRCLRCGLVRSGRSLSPGALADYYHDQYTLSLAPEHEFYTTAGPVPRSVAFADWLASATDADAWRGRVLEVGAGSGRLMDEIARRFGHASVEGIEPSREGSRQARGHGLSVQSVSLDDLEANRYDLAYSIAVIEHVASPTSFLAAIRRRLRPGGRLVISQPTQDVPSYDVLFVDHLHHFGTGHLREYGRKCGFREETARIGHPLMPNFSLHVWQAAEPAPEFRWSGPPIETTCGTSAAQVQRDLARLDETLTRLARAGRRVAVFGLSEAYWVARSYSTLADFPLVCGLDDRPDQPEYARLGFPVVKPEDAVALGVQDVVLAMNKIYYEMATARLRRLGLEAHPLFR